MNRPHLTYILIHSPLVGPFTWSPVADVLRAQGFDVVVPGLTDDDHVTLPFWQQHAAAVARALAGVPHDHALALVGHSGAGPLLPAIRRALDHQIAAYVFVDAGLPHDGANRLDLLAAESSEFADQLRHVLEAGGRFPTWSDDQLRAIIPNGELRRRMLAEIQPRALPFFTEPIPVFDGWPDAPCAYLHFSPTYDVHAQQARQYGWPVQRIEAGHFHMLVAPEEVAGMIAHLVAEANEPL